MPGTPGAPSAVVGSTGSIVWSWTAAGGATSYELALASKTSEILASPTIASCAVTGLQPNSLSDVVVRGSNTFGAGLFSASGAAYSFSNPPVSAAVVSVTTDSVALSWGANQNPAGTTYGIEKSTFAGGFAAYSTFTTPSGTVGQLEPGGTYFFRIQAFNDDGVATAYSNVVSTLTNANLPGIPGTPVPVVLSTGGIQWSWTPSARAVNHVVYEVSDLQNPLAVLPGTSVTFTGLAPNSQQTIVVVGTNSFGGGQASPAVSTHTFAAVPAGLAVLGVTSLYVSLTWTANGNPAGTLYELRKATDGVLYTTHSTYTVAGATVAGLSASSSYYFQLRAFNAEFAPTAFTAVVSTLTNASGGVPPPGPSGGPTAFSVSTGDVVWQWSVSSAASGYRVYLATKTNELLGTPGTNGFTQGGLGPDAAAGIVVVPFNEVDLGPVSSSGSARTLASVPTSVTVTGVTAHDVALAWSAGGNPNITVYEVQKATPGASFLTHSTFTAPNALIQGLTAGTTYDFQVRSLNQAGAPSAFSATVSTRTNPSIPGVPGLLTPTVLSTGSISWSWTAALDAVGYQVYPASAASTLIAAPTAATVAFGDIPANTASIIVVRGVNAEGPGPLTAAATAYTFAAVPTALTVRSVSSIWASLTWSAGVNPPTTVFELQKATDGATFTTHSTYTVTVTTVPGLSPSTSQYFRIRAYNEDSVATAFSATVSTLTDASGGVPPPGSAGTPGAISVSTGHVYWQWSGASAAAGYRVYLATKPAELLGTPAANEFTQGGLGPNEAAGIVVVPFNDTDVGQVTASGSGRTLARPPTGLAFTSVAPTTAGLTWSADGNPSGTTYEVEVATEGGGFVSESTETATSTTVFGLVTSATYSFRVRAYNNASVPTAYSGTISTVTPIAPPGATGTPTPAAVSTDTVVWAWTAASGATSYEVRRATGTSELMAAPPSTGTTFLGLGPNALSGIVVRGVNAGGGGPLSASATAYTLARAPTALTVVTVSSVSADVSWSPDGNPSGTTFEVQVATEGGAFAAYSTTTAAALSVGGLMAASTYSVQVRAFNDGAVPTAFSGTVSTRTLGAFPGPAGAPAGTAVSTSDVGWSWTASSNATSYEVRLATDTARLLASPATNSVVLTGYAPNTVSSIVVRGVNAVGPGPLSGAGSRHSLAAVPGSLSVTSVSSLTIGLSWTAAGNAAGTVFELQAATDAATFSVVSTGTATAALLPGLQPGTTHDFRIRAVNGDGLASSLSAVVSTPTLPPAPGPPGTPSATDASTDTVSWAWAAAAGATAYEVRRASNVAELIASTGAAAITFTALGPNAPSGIVVRGFNAVGFGPLSASATRHTLARAPTGLAVVSVGSSVVGVSWSGDGDPAGTVFEVQAATQGGAFGAYSTTTALNLTLTGLLPSATYSMRVRAFNAEGVDTAFSGTVSTQTSLALPSAPGTPVATVLSTGGVFWSWAPASGASSYQLVLATNTVEVLASPAGPSATLTGYTPNSVSSVVVRGVNATGTGPPSAFSAAFTFAATPSALAVQRVTSLWARIAWSGGTNPAGTLYGVEKSTDNALFVAHSTYAVAEATVTGLGASTTYYFRVAAFNGASVPTAYSNTASTTTDASGGLPPPGIPGIPAPVVLSTGDVSWSWVAASNATSYKVFLATKTTELLAAPAGTSVVLSLYGPNSVSSVVVRGVNEVEDGPPSAAVSTWTFALPPGAPALVSVGSATATLTWGPGGNPGGTRFEVETSAAGGPFALSSATVSSTAALTGLLPSTTYEFRVRAANGKFVPTAYAASVTTRTLPALPGIPGTPVALALSSGDVRWSWAPATDAASYELYLSSKTSELLAATALTTATLRGFTPNSPSGIVVRAVNATGAGSFSASAVAYSSAVTPASFAVASVSSDTVSLAWSAAGNSAGTVYEVEEGSDGVTYLPFSTTTAATLLAGGLAPASTHWFRLRALNGDSFPTAFAAAVTTRTLPTLPGVPGTPVAVAQSTADVSWSWAAASDAAGYEVYRASQTSELLASPTGAGVVLTGLEPNGLSGIVVRAVNPTGPGALSPSATAYSLAATPASFALSAVSSAAISLSWGAAGNPAGTVYDLQGSTDVVTYGTYSTTTATSLTFFPLPPATTYSFRLRAFNDDALASAFTAVVTTRTRLAPPGVPGVPTAVALSTGDLSWSWAPASSATTYRLVRASAPAQVLASVSTTTAVLSGFLPNSLSGVAVQAVNETAVSALTAAATAHTLALAPASLAVVQVATTAVLVGWNAGTNSAGTNFEVQSSSDDVTFGPAGTTSAAVFSVASLEPGATYYVRVRAVNGDGAATAFSNTVSTRTPLSVPTAPGVPSVVLVTTADVKWEWAASTGATSYRIVLATQTASVLSAPATNGTTLTGYAPNSLSSVAVQGVNVDGVGPLSVGAGVYTLAAAPSTLAFVSVGSGTASLSWDGAGNVPGTLFRTQVSTDGALYADVAAGTATALSLGALNPSSTYYARVRAENGNALLTAFSNVASTFTLPPLPEAPTAPVGAALSVSAVSWSWAASSYSASYEVLLASKTSELLAATTATAVTLSGFTPNQPSAIVVRGVNVTGTGGLSPSATRYTLAEAPTALDLLALSSAAATLIWNGGTNPPGTLFSLEASASGGAFAVAGTTTGTVLSVAGLSPAVLYEFRVNALNGDLNPTAYSNGYSTTTLPALPGTPGAPSGTAVGVSSVQWTWAAAANAATYRVYTASSPADVIGVVGAASYLQTGLAPNTTAALLVGGVNATGAGPQSSSSTAVYTLANPPSGTAATAVYATSATLSWALNSNPAGTSAELQRSTDGAAFSSLSVATTTARTDTSLLVCTSYYYRARNFNGAGVASGFDAAVSLLTLASSPTPPGSLSAAAAAGNRVVLGWDPSPSESVVEYRVYYDAGTGAVSYAAPLAVVPSSVSAFTTGVLASSAAYRFALRAFNRCGLEDGNTSVLASAPSVTALSGVSAAVIAPQAGKRVKGNSLTLSAAMTVGAAGSTSKVVFQYRVSSGTQWVDIATDTAEPFYVHWNADALGLGVDQSFDLRAVASDLSGTADAAPSAVTLTVVPSGSAAFDVSESLVGGKVQRSQSLDNAVSNTLVTGGGAGGVLTKLQVPAGALSDPNVVVTVVNDPTGAPAAPSGVESIGVITQVTLGNGQTTFAGGKTAALTLGYPDENGDGIVDGTTVRVDRLRMYSAATAAGPWVQDFGSSVDTSNRGVTGNTPHFSFFALFVGAASDLASLRVYPVPFMPNNADADDGVPYAAGNANSGIVFDNLPASATIEVFTVTGQRVAKFTTTSGAGRVQWDVKNDRGADVASGGYVAVVTSPGVFPVIKKLLVVR